MVPKSLMAYAKGEFISGHTRHSQTCNKPPAILTRFRWWSITKMQSDVLKRCVKKMFISSSFLKRFKFQFTITIWWLFVLGYNPCLTMLVTMVYGLRWLMVTWLRLQKKISEYRNHKLTLYTRYDWFNEWMDDHEWMNEWINKYIFKLIN